MFSVLFNSFQSFKKLNTRRMKLAFVFLLMLYTLQSFLSYSPELKNQAISLLFSAKSEADIWQVLKNQEAIYIILSSSFLEMISFFVFFLLSIYLSFFVLVEEKKISLKKVTLNFFRSFHYQIAFFLVLGCIMFLSAQLYFIPLFFLLPPLFFMPFIFIEAPRLKLSQIYKASFFVAKGVGFELFSSLFFFEFLLTLINALFFSVFPETAVWNFVFNVFFQAFFVLLRALLYSYLYWFYARPRVIYYLGVSSSQEFPLIDFSVLNVGQLTKKLKKVTIKGAGIQSKHAHIFDVDPDFSDFDDSIQEISNWIQQEEESSRKKKEVNLSGKDSGFYKKE